MVRYARFGGLFNEVWKMSFQGKKIQILVFYPPLTTSYVAAKQLANRSESSKGSHHKKKSEKFGKNSLMGGRGKIFFKKVPISIWELRKSKGGVSIFQKCPNLNYFAIILKYYLYKKCLKIKNV